MRTLLSTLLIILFFVVSCNDKKASANEELFDNVMASHDEIMFKMSDIMKYKKQLNSKLDELIEVGTDSVQMDVVRKAVEELEKSHEEMMNWMHGFSNDFEGKTNEEIMTYLNDQKGKIVAVGDMTDKALKQAEDILAE